MWPRYDAAVLGFRNYWYPVLASRQVGRKPRAVTLCGERIVLVRDGGRVYGLHNRCPHRGVPLSMGRREFPGTLTCAYHGWTYDLASGRLEVVLTDGPDSAICGKANVRTFPVEERAGLIWVYVGDDPPPPVETDIPAELLRDDAVVEPLVEIRRGNWRYAMENSVDEGHAKYLHRNSLWGALSQFPAWTRGVRMVPSEDGQYLMRVRETSVFEDTYPRIGRWPAKRPWQSKGRGPSVSLGARLPSLVRVVMSNWTDYEYFVPVDATHHRAMLVAVAFARGAEATLFRARYRAYIRPLYYGLLNRGQDQWMIEQMEIPPERLSRPEESLTAWRKWCQAQARGAPIAAASGSAGNGSATGAAPTGTLAAARG
jgi:phenylpropionate dioxygenase-like ring-hydroxylating dioxygenase large terminal subunit